MLRATVDRLISYVGLLLAVLLLIVAGLAYWGYSFAGGTVRDQLSAQRITMPVAAAMGGLSEADKAALMPYAGTPLDSGDKAKAYGEHYIAIHMNNSGINTAGVAKAVTYGEASGLCTAAKKADPTQAQKATQDVCNLRETLFMGDTLRSMLLTAYAFGTIGTIAFYGFIATLIAGLGMLVLSLLGFAHAKKAGPELVGAPDSAKKG